MQTPVDVVREFVLECWGKGRISLVHSLIHRDYVANGSPSGPETVIANIQANRSAIPDLVLSIDECVAQDNSVAAMVRFNGTHLNTWLGIEATGRPFEFSEACFWTIQDGKIIRGRYIAEALAVRIHLGQIPEEVWTGTMLIKAGGMDL